MEIPKLLEKYAKFYSVIQSLGELSFDQEATIEGLGLTRAMLQMGYKDIKEMGFNGTVLDYVCWLSAQYILIEWEKNFDGIDFLILLRSFKKMNSIT